MKRWFAMAVLPLVSGCIIIKPPEKPVHLIVDVNVKVKVERELDEFFDFQEKTPEKPEKPDAPEKPAKPE